VAEKWTNGEILTELKEKKKCTEGKCNGEPPIQKAPSHTGTELRKLKGNWS